MRMNSKNDKILEEFLRRLKSEFGAKLQTIMLFGSRARGDSVEESDYDLLLVFDRVTKELKEAINEIEGDMLYDYGAVFSAFPINQDDLERMKFEPFILNAQKEGIVL